MRKIVSALLTLLLLAGAFAVSAGAVPFPGTDLLTVTEAGAPAAGVAMDLYRVNETGGPDTFLGAYVTDENGSITASHITTGVYRWNSEKTGDVFFRITGAGFVRTAAEIPEAPADGREQMTYMSADGFQIRYNALLVESRETGDHSAEFVCLGDNANKVAVSWIEGKQPEEVLYEVTFDWGDPEAILRTEGLFPGTDDKWGYWRTFTDGDAVKCAIAGEYNGGVLLFEIASVLTGDEAADMAVSDTLAEIIDSVTYFDFGEQTMYAYIPGTYTAAGEDGAEYKVVLNADHTGTISFQDSVDILWGSIELFAPGASCAYTVEGDNLYVELDGVWTEFARQAE